MKNYYNSKLEYENKIDRIKILKRDIEDLNLKLTKITSTIQEGATGGNGVQSKIHTYTVQKITKEEELKELQQQIDFEKPIIEKMEKRVSSMVGLEKEVFEMFYSKNIKAEHIATLKSYSVRRIYQVLEKVNKKLGIK